MRSLLLATSLLLLSSANHCGDPYVTPTDTSAGNLDVKAVVVDSPHSTDGKNIVVMQFSFGGKPVRFADGETITCNGVTLSLNSLVFGYAERVPMVSVGGTYHFVYTSGAVSTPIDLTVPSRVVFTSPVAGATVARSNNMTIQYLADGGTGVDASGSGPSGGLSRNVFEPDNGTYTGMNSSTFGVGAGELSLTRRFESSPGGTGFHSAKTQYDSISSIAVTWN